MRSAVERTGRIPAIRSRNSLAALSSGRRRFDPMGIVVAAGGRLAYPSFFQAYSHSIVAGGFDEMS
jgi:hypothetical protein